MGSLNSEQAAEALSEKRTHKTVLFLVGGGAKSKISRGCVRCLRQDLLPPPHPHCLIRLIMYIQEQMGSPRLDYCSHSFPVVTLSHDHCG